MFTCKGCTPPFATIKYYRQNNRFVYFQFQLSIARLGISGLNRNMRCPILNDFLFFRDLVFSCYVCSQVFKFVHFLYVLIPNYYIPISLILSVSAGYHVFCFLCLLVDLYHHTLLLRPRCYFVVLHYLPLLNLDHTRTRTVDSSHSMIVPFCPLLFLKLHILKQS